MEQEKRLSALEALLFAAGKPLGIGEIAELMTMEKPQVWELVSTLQQRYQAEDRGLMIREVAGGFQLVTKPEHYELLTQLEQSKEIKLTNAALETLAIVAFKQPVTRAEIEAIRGVKAEKVVNTLLDLDLINEVGRKKALGNPILYGTTEQFLETFGLPSLEDLPQIQESALEEEDELSDEQRIEG